MFANSGALPLLGGAQPVIPPNLYSFAFFMNIIVWGPQVNMSYKVRSNLVTKVNFHVILAVSTYKYNYNINNR